MNSKEDFIRSIEAFASPAQCLNDVVQAWTEYLKVAEEEKTKRCDIRAREKVEIAEIQAKRNLLDILNDRLMNEQKIFRHSFNPSIVRLLLKIINS